MDSAAWSIVVAHLGGVVVGANLVLLVQALRSWAAAEQRDE